MKSIKNCTNAFRRIILKMRLKNLEFGVPVTMIKIQDIQEYRFTAIVYTKQWAPEIHSFNFKSKLYVNEFLIIQKTGFDLKELSN